MPLLVTMATVLLPVMEQVGALETVTPSTTEPLGPAE